MPVPIELKEKIKRIANLPTLPQVASHLMQCVNDPDSSSSDVADVLGKDMSLSAKVLRLSNSAFYGMPRKITNINEAIVILGFKVINTMVLSITVFDLFPDTNSDRAFNRARFWKHSILCGMISKLIAQKSAATGVNPEDAFCSGLLHDIGKVIMEQYLHNDLARALTYGTDNDVSFIEAESSQLGYTHADVAEWLISRWNLPDVIYYPIVHHHNPLKINSFKINTGICHLADYLCYDKDIVGTDESMAPPPFVCECYDSIGLSLEQIEGIKDAVPDELDSMAAFFDVLK